MKFSSVVKGKRSLRPVTLPMPDGESVLLSVRPLLGFEEADAMAQAREYAIEKGVADPREGDRLLEIGLWSHTLALACVDSESPDDPFFDGGAAQILEHLDLDSIAYLYETQRMWQDQCSPRVAMMSGDDLAETIVKIVEAKDDDDGPFVRLRPVLRWTLVRTMASLLVSSQARKFSSGSDSESDSKKTESKMSEG